MERIEEMKMEDAKRCPILKNFSEEQKMQMYRDMTQKNSNVHHPHKGMKDVIKEGFTKSKIEEVSTTDSSASNGLI